ncbi:YdbH domain-containing protein [Sphingomonas sp. ASV193]|uniref:intermembrane phospholipid transport protein YdbH family protein n=1 Tax=Sphingomonas sp. ASV193 TaxID=3144405 RepID=UPI0032E8E911
MSVEKGEGLPAEVAEELGEAGLAEPVVVRSRSGWHTAWKVTRLGLLVILGLAIAAAVALWIERKPIANNVLESELEKRGVTATYHLDKIGLRTQQVSNLVIGDPANPDLTARVARIEMRILLTGRIEVYRIYARGVHLNARVVGNRVSFGQVDRLLPAPSANKEPFKLPDITVDLADSTIRLDTPYGRLGFALMGRGNLSGGFEGRAAAASARLTPGRCVLDDLHADLIVKVTARRPHVTGPVRASAFGCPVSNLAIAAPRLQIDSDFSEGFDTFDGSGRMSLASMTAGVNGIANATGDISFKGSPTRAGGRVRLAAQAARLARIYADRTRLDGVYALGATNGTLDLAADFGASRVKLDPSLTAGLTGALDAASKTPIGPLAKRMGGAIATFASNLDVTGKLALVNRPGTGGVRVRSADARGPTGAEAHVSGGDGITYYWPSGKIRVDSNIATRGGGLPDARVSLHQPRGGGPLTGSADVAPYAVGNSRLALAPVRFSGLPDGGTRVSTVALLDGDFPGGAVRGLRMPLDGRFGGTVGLRIGEGCIDARFAALQYGALRLGNTALPLCPTDGAIIVQRPGGPVRIGAETRNLRLDGTLGKSPLALSAARARLGDRMFALAATEMRLGKPDKPVVIDAAALNGTITATGVAGRFSGAKGVVGAVPIMVSEAAGRFGYARGTLTVDTAGTVSDRVDPSRFYPLKSNDLHLTLAGDWVRATGTLLQPSSGIKVTDVAIAHRLSSGAGTADLDVPGIRFASRGLQPTDLTRLAEGIVALVNGEVSGKGHIAWGPDGKVASTGDFHIADTDLAAPFGPVTGLDTTIHFSDLLGLETPPGQSLTVASINPGILVENGVVRYQLLPDKLVKIERGEWPFMGGTLVLQETVLNFAKSAPKRLTFEVHGLDAHTFVTSLGFGVLDASGKFDGVLPMIFDETGGRIVGGRLDSLPPGGELRYLGPSPASGLAAKFAFDALKDLKFRSMIIRLDGALDGEFATRIAIDGVGLGQSGSAKLLRTVTRKLPLRFNVTIKGPFRALIATAKSFRDPRTVIGDVLPRPLEDIPGIVTEVRNRKEDDPAPAATTTIKLDPPSSANPAK